LLSTAIFFFFNRIPSTEGILRGQRFFGLFRELLNTIRYLSRLKRGILTMQRNLLVTNFRGTIHLLLGLLACVLLPDRLLLFAEERVTTQEPLHADQIYDPNHIVEVIVELKAEDWLSLCGQSRGLLEALGQHSSTKPFTYFRANVTIDGRKINNIGVRKKGFLGSLDSTRPSLKIKFDEFVDQQPSVGFDRLTLNNNKQDPSRLSQYLSYKIFNESGTVASRCNFARVTVNGKYLGIYSNVEPIKPPFLARRFGDNSGALFEGTVVDFDPDSVERFEKKNDAAKFEYVRELAEIMDRDQFTLEELGEVLDIQAFIKFWATESLIGFWDGYTNNQNNFFVYRHPATKKFYFIPWGVDSAFADSVPLSQFKAEVKSVHSKSILANRLYYRPEIQKLYFKTINQLLEDHWQEDALIAEVEKAVDLLKKHILPANRRFDRAVANVKAFIRGRRATIEKDLQGGVAKITKGARRAMSLKVIGSATGTFSTQWSETSPRKPTETGAAQLKVVFAGKPIEFGILGVTAEPGKDKNSREANGRMPPSIVFHGRRKSNNQPWMMTLATNSESFHTSLEPAPVNGIVIEGNPLWFFAKMMMSRDKLGNLILVGGTVTFDKAKRETGAPVIGTVKVDFAAFQGGDHMPRR
jgi:spore coat protein CotH